MWRSGCCDPSSPWDSPEDHSWMELSTPGPSWGQNQLWIKEESISCYQTPRFYLQFPLPPAGCCCGSQGRWEPLHHPLCQPWSCQKILSSFSFCSACDGKAFPSGQWPRRARCRGFCIPPAQISLGHCSSCPSLLLGAPGSCFIFHEGSFVVAEHFEVVGVFFLSLN